MQRMIIEYLMYLIAIVIIIIISIDVIPIFINWLGRIKIGKYVEKSTWKESITSQGVKWVLDTPKIKITDNNRFIVLDILKGNYSSTTLQHWQQGALILGLAEYIKHAEDQMVIKNINKFLRNNFDKHGQWINKPEHVDSAILIYAIMKLEFVEASKYRKAIDYTYRLVKEHIGEDGTVKYRKFMADYRYVDTIGFICPFLVSYGIQFKNEEAISLAIKQIKEYKSYGMLSGSNIPFHAYHVVNKNPLGLYGWGRGLGWYAIGLIDAWNELPSDHQYKSCLSESVKNFALDIISHQQKNGNWNWTISRKEARADSSATATLGWFLINAAKIEEISKECLGAANNAIDYLMKVTRRNGTVDYSQGDTKDIGVYSMNFDKLPFTQGFSIRLINYILN